MEQHSIEWQQLAVSDKQKLFPYLSAMQVQQLTEWQANKLNEWYKLDAYYSDRAKHDAIAAKHPKQQFKQQSNNESTTQPRASDTATVNNSKRSYSSKGTIQGETNQGSLF